MGVVLYWSGYNESRFMQKKERRAACGPPSHLLFRNAGSAGDVRPLDLLCRGHLHRLVEDSDLLDLLVTDKAAVDLGDSVLDILLDGGGVHALVLVVFT